MRLGIVASAAVMLSAASAGSASADGYPPFYGYSPYFGGPATYFTHDPDVRSASILSDGLPGFGKRVYYRGGPFWHYRSVHPRRAYYPRHHRRRVVLTRKG